MDRQLADKQSKTKRGLTLEFILNYSNEDAQKEFNGVEAAISDLIREIMPRAKFMNDDDIVEDFVCSDETFLQSLKIVSGRDDEWEFLEMTFWELESEIVKVGDYRVSRNVAPILESLFNRFGDISASSTFNSGTKTRLLNIFCGVVHSMCNTMVKDINENLLFNWWKNFKLVQHAGFNIQFAFDHLYRFVNLLFRTGIEFKNDEDLWNYQKRIDGLTTELENLKVEQNQHIRFKKRKSILQRNYLIADIELLSKTVGTGLL